MVLESVVHNQCLKRWKSVYISSRKLNFKFYIHSRATLRSNSRSPGRSKSVRLAKCVRDRSGIRWSSGCCSHSRQRRFQRALKMKSRWLDNPLKVEVPQINSPFGVSQVITVKENRLKQETR
jgi:hypothetical protein